jgi:hypothetical protein
MVRSRRCRRGFKRDGLIGTDYRLHHDMLPPPPSAYRRGGPGADLGTSRLRVESEQSIDVYYEQWCSGSARYQ